MDTVLTNPCNESLRAQLPFGAGHGFRMKECKTNMGCMSQAVGALYRTSELECLISCSTAEGPRLRRHE